MIVPKLSFLIKIVNRELGPDASKRKKAASCMRKLLFSIDCNLPTSHFELDSSNFFYLA